MTEICRKSYSKNKILKCALNTFGGNYLIGKIFSIVVILGVTTMVIDETPLMYLLSGGIEARVISQ